MIEINFYLFLTQTEKCQQLKKAGWMRHDAESGKEMGGIGQGVFTQNARPSRGYIICWKDGIIQILRCDSFKRNVIKFKKDNDN